MDVRRGTADGGGWAADCECGLTTVAASEVEGWLWLANHECATEVVMPMPRVPTTAPPATADWWREDQEASR